MRRNRFPPIMNRIERRKRNAGYNNGGHGHGLYFHSSIPKALVIKPSNIRIWIHDKDIDKLMKVVLEGHGQKLRQEVSSNGKVRRFLEYVPHFLGLIKSIHTAVIENNIELLQAKIAPPVPPQMLSCKDSNGLTPLHKAAGLAHTKILEYLLEVWPNAVQEVDNNGRTALHYASSTRNNERAFNLLVQAGADEMAIDGKGRMPAYYKKVKNGEEIDRGLLTVIPDAPRIAEQGFPSNFSWDILPSKFYEAAIKNSHSEINLSNLDNGGGESNGIMKPSVSAFEILTRSDSILNNDEGEKEEEAQEEEVTKMEATDVDRPKSYNLKDMNNNSAKSENDDDDVETVQTAETETLLPDEKLYEQMENENDNEVDEGEHADDEQDYPTDNNDNGNEVDVNDDIVNNLVEQVINDDDDNKDEEGEENQEEVENIESDIVEAVVDALEEQEQQQEEEQEEENDEEEEDPETEMNQEVTSDHDESTIVNNDNNDSAYETNENDIASRIQSSDTNDDIENNVDQETGENVENLDEIEQKADILIIDSNENSNSNQIDEDDDENASENDKEIENIENVDSSNVEDSENMSAENTRETGDSTVENPINENNEDEHMDEEEENDVGSPSPPFEGVIHEEPEKQNESQGGEFDNKDALNEPEKEDDIQKVINSGDMEQLATLVLNGEGKKLIGRTSKQPDIQAFLDNVPIYMGKIHKVHAAAREGSLRDLQAALDRRKFSTAKDEISPKGTTPLHVAIIFGHTAIIRYLGSRFPETLAATDDDNRTSLHYAATIKDNGHFFNLLVTLGANPKAVDNFGKTAEFYLNHDESDKILSHKDLLRSFGAAEELADEMLNDQEYKNNPPVEIPLFRTEEGRYLATSLGDPLIKGLTEVANLRPTDPVGFLANYLQTFSTEHKPKTSTIKPKRETIKEETVVQQQPVKAQPTQNHFIPNNVHSAKKIPMMAKEKSVENFIDDYEDFDATPGMDERDEHGQSMLHFAAARQHGKNALFQLIEESGVSLTYRDEIYRTARDVSLQASQPDNCKEIDRYVLSLAARGDYETFVAMLLDGYDHIVDVNDNDGVSIAQVAKARGHSELASFLDQLRDFEETREKLLYAIRNNDLDSVKEILSNRNDAAKMARAKNYYGRCSLHVAVLLENEEIVEYIATNYRQTLKIGDNLERTALHYSMGINNVEAISRILIKNGAKRVLKDLKGRTASFYYINKGDITRLQEEEKL